MLRGATCNIVVLIKPRRPLMRRLFSLSLAPHRHRRYWACVSRASPGNALLKMYWLSPLYATFRFSTSINITRSYSTAYTPCESCVCVCIMRDLWSYWRMSRRSLFHVIVACLPHPHSVAESDSPPIRAPAKPSALRLFLSHHLRYTPLRFRGISYTVASSQLHTAEQWITLCIPHCGRRSSLNT